MLGSGPCVVNETLGRLQEKKNPRSTPISGRLSETLLGSAAQLAFLKTLCRWFPVQLG